MCRRNVAFFSGTRYDRKKSKEGAANMSETKTNVCRILDKSKIHYECHSYEPGEKLDAVTAAQKMGLDPGQVFKTLVTQGKSGAYHVFVIPGAQELDL